MSAINKIDSNVTGLRLAEEQHLGILDTAANQIWLPFEPNSYSDFGGTITTVARNPINPSRQRKKGVVTDITANAGFTSDITQKNLEVPLQGYFFASLRRKTEEHPTSATASSHKFAKVTSALLAGDLIFVTGFVNSANNGLHHVTAVDGTDITVGTDTLVNETAPAAALIVKVGFQFTTGDATIVTSGSLPALTTDAMGKDLTQLGLIPGEFIYIGDDTNAAFSYTAQPTDNGFCRVRSVAAHTITFDKTSGTMVADAAAAKTIRIYFGRVLKNETGTNIVRRTYTAERILGANDDSDLTKQQAEYEVGCVADQFVLNVPTANKVTCDLTYKALHTDFIDENDDGANSILSKAAAAAGSAAVNSPEIVEADAFNTSTDVSRIKLSTFTEGTTNPVPLFAFVQEMKITINNNLDPNKAIGVVGAFEVTAGTFAVTGSMTAYFADVAAVQAVQDNADITLDAHFVKANAGISIDLPLITLANGKPNVEQDKPITLPLDSDAATGAKINSALNHTLLMVFWDYLPSVAQ